MTFGERLREKRIEANLSQEELAKRVGVHARSIQNNESGKRYPKNLEIAEKLASALGTTSQYLLSERDMFIMEAGEKGGYRAKRDISALVEEVSALFAGGQVSEEDMEAAMAALNEAYWVAKRKNKKYVPKAFRSEG